MNDNMTVAQANILLANIGYREDWTVPQLIAATSPLTRQRVLEALRVTAAAALAEADALERERAE